MANEETPDPAPAGLPPIKVDSRKLTAIREALDGAHAADVRHARKAGHPDPAAPTVEILTETPERYCPACDGTGPGRVGDKWLTACCKVPAQDRTICQIRIAAPRPTVGEWELIGVVEPMPPAADGAPSPNLLRAVPGATARIPDRYRDGDGTLCDHCNVRRARSETFAVASVADPSTVRQIGRQCLAAFLGGQSYEMIVRRLLWAAEVARAIGDEEGEGGGGGGGGRDHSHPIAKVLALTAGVVRRDGWVPRSQAGEGRPATAGKVGELLNPPPYGTIWHDKWRAEMARVAPEDGDAAHAGEALAWVRALSPRSDYEHSISTIGAQADVQPRHLGFACSILTAYDRAMGHATARATREALPTAYLGKVGDQIGGKLTPAKRRAGVGLHPEISGTVEACHATAGDYGVSTRIEVRSDDGTTLAQWWKSGEAPADLRIGCRVTMGGTVKAHRPRGGQFLTVITRGWVVISPDDSAALASSGDGG